jgi:hypothetical protein
MDGLAASRMLERTFGPGLRIALRQNDLNQA